MTARTGGNAQQFHTRLLRAIRAHGAQKEVGEALGWDPSKTSRVLSGEASVPLDEALALLAAAGLALIEAPQGDTVTISRARYRALVTLAGERLDELEGVE